MLQQMGMTETLNEALQEIGQMRPIDMSLSILSNNIMAGIVLGLPIAAFMQRTRPLR